MSAAELPDQAEPTPSDPLAAVLAAGRVGYWEHDLHSGAFHVSDEFKAHWGLPPEAPFSADVLRQNVYPDDEAGRAAAIEHTLATGAALDTEYRVIWPDGSLHWMNVRGTAERDSRGLPSRLVGVSLDITDRKRAEETLRAETENLELLNKIGAALGGNLELEAIVQIVTDAATQLSGAQFGAFFYNVLNAEGESYTLYTISGVAREAFSKFPMPRNTQVFEPTFRGTSIMRSDDIRQDPRYGKNDPYYGMPKGHLPVVSYLAVPVISRSGAVLGGLFFGHEKPAVFSERIERLVTGIAAQAAVAIDNANLLKSAQRELEERRRFESHQELLLAELNHRVKNTLAIVLSIATQTLRASDSPEAFRQGFEARILALAEAHNLLTDGNWEGASLRAIIERVLQPYRGAGTPRYVIEGNRDVRVGPKTAVSLVMALNELATNAAKYGALSNSNGTVMVNWVVSDDPAKIHLRWQETGGPPVAAPHRTGFGSRLIRALSNDAAAEVMMDFAPNGFICTFDLPLRSGVEA